MAHRPASTGAISSTSRRSVSMLRDVDVEAARLRIADRDDGVIPGGIGLDDGVGAVYLNEELVECVTSSPRAGAFRFASLTAAEETMPVRYLGA
jgi:hypothetical protein